MSRTRFPKLARGDVFTLGKLDAFGVCITTHSFGCTSAFFVDASRTGDNCYISPQHAVFMRSHNMWGFVRDGWQVKRNTSLSEEWTPPVQLMSPHLAYRSMLDCVLIEGEMLKDYNNSCDEGIATVPRIVKSLCRAVLSEDPRAGRAVISPHFPVSMPDGFVEYSRIHRSQWEEALQQIENSNAGCGKLAAAMASQKNEENT